MNPCEGLTPRASNKLTLSQFRLIRKRIQSEEMQTFPYLLACKRQFDFFQKSHRLKDRNGCLPPFGYPIGSGHHIHTCEVYFNFDHAWDFVAHDFFTMSDVEVLL